MQANIRTRRSEWTFLCPQVDLGHIYGDNLERQYHLRLFKDGKLKYQVVLAWRWDSGKGPPVLAYEDGWVVELENNQSEGAQEDRGANKAKADKLRPCLSWPPGDAFIYLAFHFVEWTP